MKSIFQEAPPLSEEDQLIRDAYVKTGRPVDDLPYTDDFERMYQSLRQEGIEKDKAYLMLRVMNLRKAGRLPRLGRSSSLPLKLSGPETELLEDLIAHFAGTVGQRDRLIYTSAFDELVEAFNRKTQHNMEPHDVWRLVARVAK